jgi:hypothetical protein
MHYRRQLLFTVLVITACASTPAKLIAASTSAATATAQAACPAIPDVQELLARHARAFGSKEGVARALPRSFAGKTVAQGKRGTVEITLDRTGRFSQSTVVGGMLSAVGVDAKGPWSLGYAGVPVRLRNDEAVEFALGAWMQGRDYLDSFDPRRDSATCTVSADGPQISVRYNLPEIGNPELNFGFSDASLLSVTHLDIYGHKSVLSFRAWSDADQTGIRWPLIYFTRASFAFHRTSGISMSAMF